MRTEHRPQNVRGGERTRVWLEWTSEEDDQVRALFPNYDAMKQALPHRTDAAVRCRAGVLSLKKKHHSWTGAELVRLKKLYEGGASQKEILRAFPFATSTMIQGGNQYNGFHRKNVRYKPTGFPIIDAIRERALKMNISMVELDAMAHSKKYFRVAAWQTGGVHGKYILRAIAALGGHLSVNWDPLSE